MTKHLRNGVVADARKISGIEFMDALGFSSPERRARYAEEGRKFAAERKTKDRRDILEMRERIARLLSPERAEKARAEWALQDQVRGEIEFTMELQQRRVA